LVRALVLPLRWFLSPAPPPPSASSLLPSSRYPRTPGDPEAPGAGLGILPAGDANAGARGDGLVDVQGAVSDSDLGAAAEIQVIVVAGEVECLCEFGRPVGEIPVRPGAPDADSLALLGATPAEEVQAAQWFDCPDEHRARRVCGVRGDVEHPVDAIDEVDIGMAWWTEHREVARGGAAASVGGGVASTTVRLSLDDAADHGRIIKDANQLFADQRVGHEGRFSAVEAAGQGEGIQFDL